MTRFHHHEKFPHLSFHIPQSPESPDSASSPPVYSLPESRNAVFPSSRTALVIFFLGDSREAYTFSAHIVWKILGRQSQFSEIGCFDDFHIGVLIPGSNFSDALRFAESIRREIPKQIPLRFRVYCTPDIPFMSQGKNPEPVRASLQTELRFTPLVRIFRSRTPLRLIPGGTHLRRSSRRGSLPGR